MTNLNKFSTLSLSLLTAGALLVPTLSVAALSSATPTATPSAMAASMQTTSDAQKETGPFKKALDNLNLTQEQRTKINKIISDAEPDFAKMRENAQANSGKLSELTFTDKFDASAVDAEANRQAKMWVERVDARAKLQNDIYNVLTPEQKTQFKNWQQQQEAKKMNRKGHK